MNSSWVIQVGLQSNDKCPYKKKAEGDSGHTEKKSEEGLLLEEQIPTWVLFNLSKALDNLKRGRWYPYQASAFHGRVPWCGFGHDSCPLWTHFFHHYMTMLLVPTLIAIVRVKEVWGIRGHKSAAHRQLWDAGIFGLSHTFIFKLVINLPLPENVIPKSHVPLKSQKTCQSSVTMK